MSAVVFSVAGIRLALRGLEPAVEAALRERFRLFVEDGAPDADLRLAVTRAIEKQYLPYPGHENEPLVYQLRTRVTAGRLHVWSYSFSGSFELGGAEGELRLCDTPFEPPVRSLENFLRVALAWKALDRGCILLHAAGLVREGRAFVFFGPSGAGKTTVVGQSPECTVLNDDLVLLARRADGAFRAHGVPFKGMDDLGAGVTGAFPIAGLFRLVQAAEDAVEPLSPARAIGELAASIPFVTERAEGFEKVFDLLDGLVGAAPVFRLRFRLSPDFWREVLRTTDPPSGGRQGHAP